MSTKFILTAQKDTLPPAPALSLLPFSLGPTNAPYKATDANISGYFCPRPIAAPVGNQSEGQDAHAAQNLQATFRGRQLVGQELALPPSYRGVILSTTLPPNKGGTEDHSASHHTPLTPAASTASVAPTEVSAEGEEKPVTGESSSRHQRKSVLAKIKGAGQIALSRPRITRSKRPEPKKRVRLDSDDEDELEVPVEEPKEAKRPRISPSTPGKPLDVPEITIEEPTPLKASTSTTPSSLRQLRSGTPTASPRPSSVIEGELPSLTEEGEEGDEGAGDGADAVSVEVQEVEDQKEDMEEQVIPSPATEDALPTTPTFNVPPPPIESPDKEAARLATATEEAVKEEHEDVEMKEEADAEEAYGGPVRLLRPTATFDRFVLYTGDAPLAGFRADELEASSAPTEPPAESPESSAPAPAGESTIDGGIQVRPSWWRLGGSGEGGDEFVRGMGEWLGLVESMNKPVYLDGIEDDDDE